MDKNLHAVFQKWLLIVTGVLVTAYIFTFPTRDRRPMIDQIRLKVGAEHLVAKRAPAAAAPGKITSQDRERTYRSVNHYCNEKYNQKACRQWLLYCGDKCKILVKKDLWAKLHASPAQARHDVRRRGR